MQQTDDLLACPNPKNRCTLHPGVKSKFDKIEDKLFKFVEFNSKQDLPVTTTILLIKFRQLNPEEKDLNNETLNKRIYRFLKRYNLSIRRPTHIGRVIYANTFKISDDFINKLIKLKNICNFTNDLIGNMDETLFLFNMPSSNIIDHKGKKYTIIKTPNQEKLRISAL